MNPYADSATKSQVANYSLRSRATVSLLHKGPVKLIKRVKIAHSFLLGGVPPSNVMCPAFLFLTTEVC